MSAKILQMPKSNQHYWDDLFRSFIRDWDKVQARHESPAGEGAPGHVGEDGGWIPDEDSNA